MISLMKFIFGLTIYCHHLSTKIEGRMPGKKILVVEDEPSIAETLVHILNKQGHSSTYYY
jgi:hypothetical protein